MKSQFFEPPWEKQIVSNYPKVWQIGAKITFLINTDSTVADSMKAALGIKRFII